MEEQTIEIHDLTQFIKMYVPWHQTKVEQVRKLNDLESGATVVLGDEEIKLTEEMLAGLKLGAAIALIEFEELPFSYEPVSTTVN